MATLVQTANAHAQEHGAATRTAARDLAVGGAEAFERGDFATALDRFQRAESLYRAPTIAIMTARSLARLGRIVEAVDKYEETRRMLLEPDAPDAFRQAVQDAGAEIEAVRAKLARLELRLPAGAPRDVEIQLDGEPVPAVLLGVPTPVDPTLHRVTARARGHRPFEAEVTLHEGALEVLGIVLEPEQRPEPMPPPSQQSADRGNSTLAYALLGVGAAGLVTGSVTGIMALNHRSELDAECKPGCPARMASDLDAFRLQRTLSYVGFGVGVIATGAGGYFLLSRGRSSEVFAVVHPTGAAIHGSF
jgi:hypothetical protein